MTDNVISIEEREQIAAEAEALQESHDIAEMTLSPGWAHLRRWLEGQVEGCKTALLTEEDTKQIAHYQATARAAGCLLGEVTRCVEERRRLSEEVEANRGSK